MTGRRHAKFPDDARRSGLVLLLVGAAVVGEGSTAVAAGTDLSKLVVVIYPSESDTAPGVIQLNDALRSTFASQTAGYTEVRNEYANTDRLDDAEFMEAQVALLKQKYSGRKVDLVIAGLSSGLDFALRYRDELFPGVPVIFVAVDQREVLARRIPPDVIGTPIQMDLAPTLDLALQLHPDTRQVFVVAGSSTFDHQWVEEAQRTFHPYDNMVHFVYLTGLRMDELLVRVGDLPEHSIIYFLHMHRDGTGKPTFSAEVLDQLAARANAPIYGHVNTYVGRGLVGGRVFSFQAEGTNAARLALRVLAGEKPSTMTVPRTSDNICMFDWRQLQKWGIDERALPPASVVQFKEATFWDSYRRPVMGIVTLGTIQTVLIVGLLLQRAKRRRAEAAERESENRFRLMADAAPVLIWVAGLDKGCTYVNRLWIEFTGRPLERELGDGWAAGIHPDDMARSLDVYTTRFNAREPFDMVYRLRRHDGDYRWVLDQGVPRFASDGKFVGYVGACLDMTDRHRTEEELRASQRELQSLAGRLIEAQEAERRRIARELHDDLSQGLALLAVELDVMARRPPASAAEAVRCLRGFSARVRELSTDVHDLSHQLHPSKVEQLGLLASVQGLCHELGMHHELTVTFAHRDVPEVIPETPAICLYRIVQEALHNVIKHAHTDRAQVELTGLPGGLRLQVEDNGDGFDPSARDGGLGLVGMRERLSLVGGQLVIDSRPGGGTRIDVRVPLPDPVPELGEESARLPAEADLVTAGSNSEELR
jgi:PAS domain S-box-containing protein